MNKVFILLLLLFFASAAYGQDQIISRKGYVINCKVIKTEADLVYFDSEVDGVVVRRCIAKSEISKVRYGVGKELKIAEIDTVKTEVKEPEAVEQSPVNTEAASKKSKISYYITAGFNLTSYRGTTYNLYEGYSDNKYYRFFPVSFGAGINASMSKAVKLQAGLEYVPKGVRFQSHFAWKFSEREVYKTNYIEVPLSLQFSPAEFKTVQGNSYYLKAGFAPAFLLTSKIVDKSHYYDGANDFKDINRFDLCTILGIGYKMQDQFAVEIRYEEGSKNILKPNDSYWGVDGVLYNRSISFTAKVLF